MHPSGMFPECFHDPRLFIRACVHEHTSKSLYSGSRHAWTQGAIRCNDVQSSNKLSSSWQDPVAVSIMWHTVHLFYRYGTAYHSLTVNRIELCSRCCEVVSLFAPSRQLKHAADGRLTRFLEVRLREVPDRRKAVAGISAKILPTTSFRGAHSPGCPLNLRNSTPQQ